MIGSIGRCIGRTSGPHFGPISDASVSETRNAASRYFSLKNNSQQRALKGKLCSLANSPTHLPLYVCILTLLPLLPLFVKGKRNTRRKGEARYPLEREARYLTAGKGKRGTRRNGEASYSPGRESDGRYSPERGSDLGVIPLHRPGSEYLAA